MNLVLLVMIFLHTTVAFSPLLLCKQKCTEFELNMKMKKDKTIEYLYKPKSSNQQKYVNLLNDKDVDIVVSTGPAGTGKTMFACLKAIDLLKSGTLDKIIITRPVVSVEEELGFLPGNINKKMDPWIRPIFDMFLEHFSKTELDNMINRNVIEISPLAYMRGRTFKNAFIIADEMQNSSPNQMMMLTTRIGKNSKLVITGDLKQTDKFLYNGLFDFVEKIKTYYDFDLDKQYCNKIEIIEFNKDDIERSKIVEKVIDIYDFNKRKMTENIVPTSDAALIPKNNVYEHKKIMGL